MQEKSGNGAGRQNGGWGFSGLAHFQDTCAAFGMETALMNMIAAPELYEAVNKKVLEFYLKANRIFYEATKGKLHAVLIGNEMGSQRGLMISPELVRRFVIPGCRRLAEQAHSYGLKVIYHSCGAISDIIPDLIDAGVDIIHPIQALAAGMEPEGLKEKFGDRVSFLRRCGYSGAVGTRYAGGCEEEGGRTEKAVSPQV